jgi:GABA permease
LSIATTATSREARPALARSLRSRHLTMISIGGIIGAGLFVGSSAAIAATGPAVVLSYLLSGALMLLVMRMLAEMALARPDVGAFTEFARAGLGDRAGFVAGWLYWYFWIVVVPIEAIAGANILTQWLPLPAWVLGLGLMAVMTAVNLLSARSYGEFEFWFSSIKVAAIVVFIALAASWALGFTSPGGPTLGNLVGHGFMPFGPAAVLAGTVAVFFSMTGAEMVTVAAAESNEPARAIARLSATVLLRILAFYAGSVFLIVCVVPWTAVVPGESPFTLALEHMSLSWAGTAMSAIILTAVLSCLNSAFFVCSRVLFVLAAQGDAPRVLVRLNARLVPTRSVWLASACGVAGVLLATAAPQAVFAFLVNASGAVILFIYILVAAAQLRLRRAHEQAGRGRPELAMWGFPWLSYAAIGGMLAVLLAMALTPARRVELATSLFALGVAVTAATLRARRCAAAA